MQCDLRVERPAPVLQGAEYIASPSRVGSRSDDRPRNLMRSRTTSDCNRILFEGEEDFNCGGNVGGGQVGLRKLVCGANFSHTENVRGNS